MSTIRDVAKRAGVAVCTVSRVLNGSAAVAPQTKERIEKAMEELNYVPNELARGMFKQKAGIIAILVPNIKHPFFSSLAHHIEQYLYEKGYKLMLCSTLDSVEREKSYLKFFESNMVDGVIMAVSRLDKSRYEHFNKPIIMLDYFVNEQIPLVVSDHKSGGRLAAQEFINNHCKYVVHLCSEGMADEVISYQGHLELERILAEHQIKTRKVEIKWNTFDFLGYKNLAKTMLEYYPEIDGVMCADMLAVAFLNAANALNKKVPDDLTIVAYDGTYIIDMQERKITTIVQQFERLSRTVVDVLIQKIDKQPLETTDIRIPVLFEKGDTT